ncbi:MAG: hypothetical protein KA354_21330 [Phycisphaerae bacterium]|nr:hypothetical protein [Phycisphaerae bacterium]
MPTNRSCRSVMWLSLLAACIGRAVIAENTSERPRPGTPPPAGREASYEWYARQYPDPNMFTLIGPPADPGDAAVSANGQLFAAAVPDMAVQGIMPRLLPGVSDRYIKRAVSFALFEHGRVLPFGAAAPIRQRAVQGFLPMVVTDWQPGDLSLTQTTFAEPLRVAEFSADNQRTLAWAAVDIVNTGRQDQDVTLLTFYTGDEKDLRPGLTWKGGAVFAGENALFAARGQDGFQVKFAPVFPHDAEPAAGDESVRFLDRRSGVFNALVITGRLGPGAKTRVLVHRIVDPGQNINWAVTPEPPPVAAKELTERSFNRGYRKAMAIWQQLAAQRMPFETPDAALNDIYRKALLDGLILTKRWDGRYIVYDSVIYRCQWDNPSVSWIYTLDLVGDHRTAEQLFDTIFQRQGTRKPGGMRTRQGCFTDVTNINRDGSPASWASCNGWALWAIAEHARLTNDRGWVEKHKKQILDGCEWIIRERRFSAEKPDNPCKGLLYGKFVCDLPADGDVAEAGYFTYTDAISFVGLYSAARLLQDWHYPEAARLIGEAELYRRDIIRAVNHLTDKSQDPWYVPWVLSAPQFQQRYFHDIVGPVNLAYSCSTGGVVPPDHELIDHTIRWIVDRVHQGSYEQVVAGTEPPTLNHGSAFYSQDLALVLLERGQVEEFLRVFYTALAAGISHGTFTTTEWGDNTQPHIHSIGSLVRMFRAMLIQERDATLYLLQGVPRAWFTQGETITIREAPTWYGPVSLRSTSDIEHQTVSLDLSLPPRIAETAVRLRLRLPGGLSVKTATASGQPVEVRGGEWLTIKGWTGQVSVVAEVGPL